MSEIILAKIKDNKKKPQNCKWNKNWKVIVNEKKGKQEKKSKQGSK